VNRASLVRCISTHDHCKFLMQRYHACNIQIHSLGRSDPITW